MRLLLSISIFLLHTLCYAADFTFTAFGSGNEKYWITAPSDSADNSKLVVFLHGHAASNPECYGDWILHLVDQGYIVLFPKYQNGTIPLSVLDSEDEQRRVEANIDSATSWLNARFGVCDRALHFIGHSLGGVLAANVANHYGATKKYRVASLCLVQPGQKHFKLGALDLYSTLDTNLRIVCVSGSNDRTAGKTFSTNLMHRTQGIADTQKIHFLLERKQHRGEVIGSTHEEPVCPNTAISGSNMNAVIAGVRLVGKTDLADTHCFWRIADFLLREDPAPLSSLADLGTWPDGKFIGEMLILR